MVNVGTSVRIGPQPINSRQQAPARALPLASQNPIQAAAMPPQPKPQPQQACSPGAVLPKEPSAAAVSLEALAAQSQASYFHQQQEQAEQEQRPTPEPSDGQEGALPQPPAGQTAPVGAGEDWRLTFDATLQAFEERYDRLQQELALVKGQGGGGMGAQRE